MCEFVNICIIDTLACVVWKWHNAFHMHQDNLEKLGVSAWHERNDKWIMVVKGISREDFPKNYLGEWSNSSSWRLTHDCFVELPSNSPRSVVQYIYRNSVVCFREKKPFVLKTMFFSHLA